VGFNGTVLLAPRPNPKLEDHPLSAVRDCLFRDEKCILQFGQKTWIPKRKWEDNITMNLREIGPEGVD
jgi:hypothetical protein